MRRCSGLAFAPRVSWQETTLTWEGRRGCSRKWMGQKFKTNWEESLKTCQKREQTDFKKGNGGKGRQNQNQKIRPRVLKILIEGNEVRFIWGKLISSKRLLQRLVLVLTSIKIASPPKEDPTFPRK